MLISNLDNFANEVLSWARDAYPTSASHDKGRSSNDDKLTRPCEISPVGGGRDRRISVAGIFSFPH